MAINYKDYISSPEWKLRSRLYRNTYSRCEICGCDNKISLHTHHISYAHLGNEPDEDLMTLCEDCHEMVERIKNYDASKPVLHYYKDTFCYEWEIKKALGQYAPICNKIWERAKSVYPPYRPEFKHWEYCQRRVTEFLGDVRDKRDKSENRWCLSWSDLDVKKLKEPEIDVEKEFGINAEVLGLVIAPYLGDYTLSRIIGGLQGKDDRITYIKDSGDDLHSFLYVAGSEGESEDMIMYSASAVIAYLLEIIDCYKYQYPNLVHNAKVIAAVMIGNV